MIKKDTISYIPAIILPILIGILIIPIYTRIFSPEEYGNYIALLTIFSFIQALSSSWIGSTIIRFNEKYTNEKKTIKFISTSILMSAFISVFISIIILIISYFVFSKNYSSLFQMIVWLPIYSILATQIELNLQFFRAKREIKSYNFFVILKSILAPALILLSYQFFENELAFVLGTIFANFVLIVIIITKENYVDILSFKNFDKEITKTIIAFGLPLAPTFLSSNAIDVSERFLIGFFENAEQLGVYGVAQTFSKNPISLVVSIISISSAPIIIKIWENEGKEKIEFFLKDLLKWYLIISVPILMLLAIYSKQILSIFVSIEYLDGYKVMPFICLGGFILGLQWISQRGLMLAEKTSTIFLGFLMSLIFNFSIGFVFIQLFGIIGVAISNVISSLIVFLYINYMSSKIVSIRLSNKSFFNIIFSGMIMFLINYSFLKYINLSKMLSLFIIGFLSSLAYVICLAVLKEIDLKKVLNIKLKK